MRKLQEKVRKTQIRWKSHWNLWDFAKSGFNLTRFNEISLNSVKISLDLREIVPESGFFIAEIWVFIAGIWNFLVGIWVSAGWFGFSRERNRNRLAGVGLWWRKSAANLQSRLGRSISDRIRSGLRVGQVIGYVWTALFQTHVKFQVNQMLFTIQSMNLFYMYNFRPQKLRI